MVSCAFALGDSRQQPPPVGPDAPVAAWERIVRGAYENKGIAQVERLGDRWVLNVMCDGVHATYIDDTTLDLPLYSQGYVNARYHYVDRINSNARCVQGPCPPVQERRVALERLTVLTATREQASEKALTCE